MIFVSVGMHVQGFDRLIQKMDEIAGKINEEVIMQIGFTKYLPKNAKFFQFASDVESLNQLFKEARIVVCHGGAGTIITALDLGVPVIAVPRLKRYHESLNDHQLELVNTLAKNKTIIAAQDVNELDYLIMNHNGTGVSINNERKLLIAALKEYIRNFEKKEKKN